MRVAFVFPLLLIGGAAALQGYDSSGNDGYQNGQNGYDGSGGGGSGGSSGGASGEIPEYEECVDAIAPVFSCLNPEPTVDETGCITDWVCKDDQADTGPPGPGSEEVGPVEPSGYNDQATPKPPPPPPPPTGNPDESGYGGGPAPQRPPPPDLPGPPDGIDEPLVDPTEAPGTDYEPTEPSIDPEYPPEPSSSEFPEEPDEYPDYYDETALALEEPLEAVHEPLQLAALASRLARARRLLARKNRRFVKRTRAAAKKLAGEKSKRSRSFANTKGLKPPIRGHDADIRCCFWAKMNECHTNKYYMRPWCQKSCGTIGCRVAEAHQCRVDLDVATCPWTDSDVLKFKRALRAKRRRQRKARKQAASLKKPKSFRTRSRPDTQPPKKRRSHSQEQGTSKRRRKGDAHPLCSFWASIGECSRAEKRGTMWRHCPRACVAARKRALKSAA